MGAAPRPVLLDGFCPASHVMAAVSDSTRALRARAFLANVGRVKRYRLCLDRTARIALNTGSARRARPLAVEGSA